MGFLGFFCSFLSSLSLVVQTLLFELIWTKSASMPDRLWPRAGRLAQPMPTRLGSSVDTLRFFNLSQLKRKSHFSLSTFFLPGEKCHFRPYFLRQARPLVARRLVILEVSRIHGNSTLKTNYSNFGAWSSKKFEIAAFFSQWRIITNTKANQIASKRQQFQTCWKIMLRN